MPPPNRSGHPLMRRYHVALRFGIITLILTPIIAAAAYSEAPWNPENQHAAILLGAGGILLSLLLFFFASRPPTDAIMQLAKENHGILTLSEIITTLRISPKRAHKALRILQSHGIASPRWQEIRKNIWEFPDYMTLPLSESLELAKTNGGTLTLEALTAAGHTTETARQTLDALHQTGLAHPDPAAATSAQPALIVTTQ
jgi:hypothetical protein